MRRSLATALLLAAAPAGAQFQARPLRLRAALDAELVAARLSGGAADDLLVTRPPGALFQRYTWPRDLLALHPLPVATPADGGYLTGGRFEPSAGAEDLVYGTLDGLKVEFGADPAVLHAYPAIFSSPPLAIGQARLLPRAEAEVLASLDTGSGIPGQLRVVDLSTSRTTGAVSQVTFAVPPFFGAVDGDVVDRVYPIRLSPAARSGGLDDVVMPLFQGLYLLWHRSVPAAATLGALDVAAVTTGASDAAGVRSWLPAGLQVGGSALGAAAIDADGDGTPDLVFSYAFDRQPAVPGTLLYARNTGDPAGLSTPPWGKLSGRADLATLVDPLTLRQLPLATPTMAVYDRALGEILIVQGDARTGFTVAQHLEAPGGLTVREMVLADVVGSPAPDLVVYAVRTAVEAEVWVYPDAFDAAPTVAFDPAPARALRGQDLPVAVAAADVDSPFTVAWMVGGRLTPPVATGAAWTVPGSLLCQVGTLDLTARATDDLGVFAEAAAAVPVLGEPSLRLAGASPDRLLLPPGGAAGEALGSAWPACGRTATFTWSDAGLPGLVQTSLTSTASSSRRAFTLPESAYPAALAGAPALTLSAVDDLGASGSATLPLQLDAAGLVGVQVAVDRALLARGEVAVATARVESRLGVALPGVRVAFRLAGLAPAGAVSAVGAAVAAGAGEGEAIVDLPAAGAAVTLSLPVRSLGGPGAVSAEAFASGGARLSPAAEAAAPSERLPGCGCGGGGAGWPALLSLVALVRRRRRAT
jgi:uncharacterized protein (TIGR03382 family)